MKAIFKNEYIISLLIGASYLMLWAAALLISVDFNLPEFLQSYTYTFWQNSYMLAVVLLIFHVLLKFIAKRKRKTGWRILFALLILLLLSAGYQAWLQLGMEIGTYPEVEKQFINNGYYIRGIIYQLYGIAYFTSVKLVLHVLQLKSRNNQLLLEKKIAELHYLKSQTNPHFLFNTLNNIYSLANAKSDLTAGSVLRLSEILRYMLYGAEAGLVRAEKEISIIKEYIELERLRYDDTLKIIFDTTLDDPRTMIPPLLMLPLVENAFKHGVSQTIIFPFITIRLSIVSSRMKLTVENSKSPGKPANYKENIGINNLRKQLELLFSDYQLAIENREKTFFVYLSINLNSYAKV